jgi:hypothetical protein
VTRPNSGGLLGSPLRAVAVDPLDAQQPMQARKQTPEPPNPAGAIRTPPDLAEAVQALNRIANILDAFLVLARKDIK